MVSRKPLVLIEGGTVSELPTGDTIDVSTDSSYTVISASQSAPAGSRLAADTSSNTITLTLPASPNAGDRVKIKDYKRTFADNNVICDLGSRKVEGEVSPLVLDINGIEADMIYVDSAVGWLVRFKF